MVDKQYTFFAMLKRHSFDFFLFQRPLENLATDDGGAGRNHEVEGKIRQLSCRPTARCGIGVKMHVAAKQNEVDVWLFGKLNGSLQVVGYHRFEA